MTTIDITRVTDFDAVAKNTYLVAQKILENEKLCKLIYYNNNDPLHSPALNDEQKSELFDKLIAITPHLPTIEEQRSALMIRFDNFIMNETNPHYMDNTLLIDVICHKDLWKIKGKYFTTLRPYAIAHELYKMFHDRKMEGIGKCNFIAAELLILGNDTDYSGIALSFQIINSAQ